jgi:chromosome partitioning protein
MKVVAVANAKGGSGKTTTTVHLAAAAVEAGHRALLVDFDQQGSATRWLRGWEDGAALAEGLRRKDLSAAVVPVREGLDLVPSGPDLGISAAPRLGKSPARDDLKRSLAPLLGSYDFVVIDVGPAVSDLMWNALAAAEGVIVPVECSSLALTATRDFDDVLETGRKLNPRLKLIGVVPVRVSRTTDAAGILEVLRSMYGKRLLTPVPESVVARRLVPRLQTVIEAAPRHPIAAVYREVYETVRKAR